MIQVERVYNIYPLTKVKGRRILVDRRWPRGIKKEKTGIDDWIKEIAPSQSLRRWFNDDADRWGEFRKRYIKELEAKKELVGNILDKSGIGTVVLLYGARDEQHNNAVVLKEYIEKLSMRKPSRRIVGGDS